MSKAVEQQSREVAEFMVSPGGRRVCGIVRDMVDEWQERMVLPESGRPDVHACAGGIAFARELMSKLGTALSYGEYVDEMRERQTQRVVENLEKRAAQERRAAPSKMHPAINGRSL